MGAVYVRRSDGTSDTYYVTTDHLGSTDKVLNAAGGVVTVAESFTALGARRGSTWQGTPTPAELAAIAATTRDGFTGHEMLDGVGLIHMRGRVYDPTVGRFLSVDPIVRDVDASQSWNGYGYVEGRTLSWTDPSGYEAQCIPTGSIDESPDGHNRWQAWAGLSGLRTFDLPYIGRPNWNGCIYLDLNKYVGNTPDPGSGGFGGNTSTGGGSTGKGGDDTTGGSAGSGAGPTYSPPAPLPPVKRAGVPGVEGPAFVPSTSGYSTTAGTTGITVGSWLNIGGAATELRGVATGGHLNPQPPPSARLQPTIPVAVSMSNARAQAAFGSAVLRGGGVLFSIGGIAMDTRVAATDPDPRRRYHAAFNASLGALNLYLAATPTPPSLAMAGVLTVYLTADGFASMKWDDGLWQFFP